MNSSSAFRNLLLKKDEVAERWKRTGRPVIGWTCSYVPEEVIYASEALPVMIFGDTEETTLADAYLPVNSCSFSRSCLNSALKGKYRYLDGYVTSNSCDSRNKIFDMWKHHTEIPHFYFINTPRTRFGDSRDFFYEETVRFKAFLEETFGQAISDVKLREAIAAYNENRNYLREVYALRRQSPPLISGVEAVEIVLSSMVIRKEEHNELLRERLSDISDQANPPREGLRVLISGSVMDDTRLLKVIEDLGCNVVADDLCTGSRYFWENVESKDDPLKAIARRYLGKAPSSFMVDQEARIKHTMAMVEKFHVEAAIIIDLKFCDNHLFDAVVFTTAFKAAGLPVLHLEYEHSLGGLLQLRTRIEAFVEMVRGVV
ncbi:MAG: 2-hydroxyacyl-CoA dehydratase [Candidatus Bathyarchaeota archaeon]|nr:MAG: 2-hydroxyacyl-CoA dehydratase [Candidatus Bathyarchaeota archaeon]